MPFWKKILLRDQASEHHSAMRKIPTRTKARKDNVWACRAFVVRFARPAPTYKTHLPNFRDESNVAKRPFQNVGIQTRKSQRSPEKTRFRNSPDGDLKPTKFACMSNIHTRDRSTAVSMCDCSPSARFYCPINRPSGFYFRCRKNGRRINELGLYDRRVSAVARRSALVMLNVEGFGRAVLNLFTLAWNAVAIVGSLYSHFLGKIIYCELYVGFLFYFLMRNMSYFLIQVFLDGWGLLFRAEIVEKAFMPPASSLSRFDRLAPLAVTRNEDYVCQWWNWFHEMKGFARFFIHKCTLLFR